MLGCTVDGEAIVWLLLQTLVTAQNGVHRRYVMAVQLVHIGARRAAVAAGAPDVISTPGTAGVVSVGMLCKCTAMSVAAPPDEVIVVRVAGEVDVFTCSVLQGALVDSLARSPCFLLVDLAGMTFCGVRGLTTLVQAGATAAERGIGYAVASAPAQVTRLWPMLWPANEVPVQFAGVDIDELVLLLG